MATQAEINSVMQRLVKAVAGGSEEMKQLAAAAQIQHGAFEQEIKSFRTAVEGVPSVVQDAGDGVKSAINVRLDAIVAMLPDEPDSLADASQRSLQALATELNALEDEIGDQITVAIDRFISNLAEVEDRFTELSEFAQKDLLDNLSGYLDNLYSQVKSIVGDLPQEIIDLIDQEFNEALSSLRETADSLVEEAMGNVEGLGEELANMISSRAESLFSEEVEKIGEEVINATLNEIFDDIAITQISAQITGMMSAQLPQLVVAKNVVGAVRRGLEILRAGV